MRRFAPLLLLLACACPEESSAPPESSGAAAVSSDDPLPACDDAHAVVRYAVEHQDDATLLACADPDVAEALHAGFDEVAGALAWLGDLRSLNQISQGDAEGGGTIEHVMLHFETTDVDVEITHDASGKIAGLHFGGEDFEKAIAQHRADASGLIATDKGLTKKDGSPLGSAQVKEGELYWAVDVDGAHPSMGEVHLRVSAQVLSPEGKEIFLRPVIADIRVPEDPDQPTRAHATGHVVIRGRGAHTLRLEIQDDTGAGETTVDIPFTIVK